MDGQDLQDKRGREPRMNGNKNKRKSFSHRGTEKGAEKKKQKSEWLLLFD